MVLLRVGFTVLVKSNNNYVSLDLVDYMMDSTKMGEAPSNELLMYSIVLIDF